jgi:hypothetical protein
VSIRRQSGQFAGLFTDAMAKIGQFPQHRRHPHVIPLHCRTPDSFRCQSRAADSTPTYERRGQSREGAIAGS